ncbi:MULTISPECIES: hypothetical protein [unclassified Roseivivax]|uniref:hypothetical protein n=1 Tax=Roseivivax sp. GX 12232 TaxID=2900547 RepID=UPI001E43D33E|nr:hypothetical protein [Roseivivax sp. GX 12232]MCE0506850.1 hypothetical protein [Roseivivax sp. GX 12232]
MKRIALTATALICASAAALAASEVMTGPDPEVIEIEVLSSELADCRETLAQVASMPAVHDNGTPILFDWGQNDMPSVRCVATDV